jgi:hypothetical protein
LLANLMLCPMTSNPLRATGGLYLSRLWLVRAESAYPLARNGLPSIKAAAAEYTQRWRCVRWWTFAMFYVSKTTKTGYRKFTRFLPRQGFVANFAHVIGSALIGAVILRRCGCDCSLLS